MATMTCPRCNEAVEPGALFCGNCGLALQDAATPVIPPAPLPGSPPAAAEPELQTQAQAQAPIQTAESVPSYAVANPEIAKAESKSMTGLIVSVLSVPGAIIPILGLALAVAGLVLGTSARRLPKKTMANVAIGFSCLGLVLSVGAYAWSINDQKQQQQQATTADAQNNGQASGNDSTSSDVQSASKAISTPCYNVQVAFRTIDHADDSCTLRAMDGDTASESSEIITVDTASQPDLTEKDFDANAKVAMKTVFQAQAKDFTITSEGRGVFAGSVAYIVDAKNATGSTIQLAMVYHPVAHGDNIFVVVHGLDVGQANLSIMSKTWAWK